MSMDEVKTFDEQVIEDILFNNIRVTSEEELAYVHFRGGDVENKLRMWFSQFDGDTRKAIAEEIRQYRISFEARKVRLASLTKKRDLDINLLSNPSEHTIQWGSEPIGIGTILLDTHRSMTFIVIGVKDEFKADVIDLTTKEHYGIIYINNNMIKVISTPYAVKRDA